MEHKQQNTHQCKKEQMQQMYSNYGGNIPIRGKKVIMQQI